MIRDSGSTPPEMVSLSSHGIFFPLSTFAKRVQQVGLGGLVISHVTLEDAESYTIEVDGRDDLSVSLNVTLFVSGNDVTLFVSGNDNVTLFLVMTLLCLFLVMTTLLCFW